MDYDAFDAGVEPGGLRSRNDIRIMICYMLCGVQAPLSRQDIVTVMQENGFANYFEVMDALSGLSKMGNVDHTAQDDYAANEKTFEISQRLNTTLPSSLRERAVAAALNLLAAARRERENRVELRRTEQGYEVVCHVSGGELELMSFTLYVPDLYQARLVKKNFLKRPEDVYRILLALTTGNRDVVEELLKTL